MVNALHFVFLRENSPEKKSISKWTILLLSLFCFGTNWAGTLLFPTLWEVSLGGSLLRDPRILIFYWAWLPFNWKGKEHKCFSFYLPCTDLNPLFRIYYGDEGNSNESKTRFQAQQTWTALISVLYLQKLVLLFIGPPVYSPALPNGSLRTACEGVLMEHLWSGVNGALLNRNAAQNVQAQRSSITLVVHLLMFYNL